MAVPVLAGVGATIGVEGVVTMVVDWWSTLATIVAIVVAKYSSKAVDADDDDN